MLLKKQTVWLLTMLSLVVVLSIYYLTSPDGQMNLAGNDQEENENTETGGAVVSDVASDEEFAQERLDQMNERSMEKERLTEVAASTELPAEERSEAKDQLDSLNELAAKEEMLENLIKSMNYEDVLVKADGANVKVVVKAEEQSKTEANKIIREVMNELGTQAMVAVEFQVSK
ncbi:SpoIIIAH-like family protein [Cytobacillus sp. Sa5YUA1]|uniref:SpoIIIAH-like family protein n=1 Tax=Cytobacillus stercorigallinarum TaxID=2762240 RepID=A0ABR8QK56_9BACI|nr:SpoIIIAH-like family protein [Cytobacillus stercorigallinarum]MBD7935904.1 SpoIIIAH-like family protein [Cytobacillus stercorigallinarum]